MRDTLNRYLYNRINELWSEPGVGSPYRDTLRQALGLSGVEAAGGGAAISQWVTLPMLCCQAVEGDPSWTGDLTLAWLLFYSAAHIMDSVQDEDEPESWWGRSGPAIALNAASGLYFTAGRCLTELADFPGPATVKQAIGREFYRCFQRMNSGQHRQFNNLEIDLETYWEIASSKSGEFFALACYCGARLAEDQPERLNSLREFGHSLGMLVQIADELDDVLPPAAGGQAGQRKELASSLPAIFARVVLPEDDRNRFEISLKKAPTDPLAAAETIDYIDQCGAGRYILAELERYRQSAYQAWQRANPSQPAGDALRAFLDRF